MDYLSDFCHFDGCLYTMLLTPLWTSLGSLSLAHQGTLYAQVERQILSAATGPLLPTAPSLWLQ